MVGSMSHTVHHGDALAWLRSLSDNSADTVVQDPPAGIGFMSKSWDTFGSTKGMSAETIAAQKAAAARNEPFGRSGVAAKPAEGARGAFVAAMTAIFREERRVLKPGAHLLTWALPRTSHWTAWALEDAGLEVRDVVMHVFGSGFPKSLNLDGEHEGWGTAMKPAAEHWILARVPLAGTVAGNVQAHGTGALNVDGCRVPGVPPQTYQGPKAFGLINDDGWEPRTTMSSPNDAGRWPPHLLLTHSAACDELRCVEGCPVREMDQQSGIGQAGQPRDDRGKGGIWSPSDGTPAGPQHGDSGGASRFFPRFRYQAKPSRAEREAGLDHMPLRSAKKWNEGGIQGRRDAQAEAAIADAETHSQGLDARGRTLIREDGTATLVDRFIPQHRANVHPTVKPVDLMRWLVRLITPKGGMVLDPFTGSGTTGVACAYEGVNFAGCEQDAAYVEIALARIAHANGEGSRAAEPLGNAAVPSGQLGLF